MLELTNHESDASENGNSKYEDTTDGPRRPLDESQELDKRRKDLADMAVWMSGLEATECPLDDPVSLCRGRAFAELLHHIDSNYFHKSWLNIMIEQKTTSNMVVKGRNVRNLWRKMSDYVTEILNREIKSSRWTGIGDRVGGIEDTDLLVAVDIGMVIVAFALIGRNQEHFVEYSKNIQGEVMQNIAQIVDKMKEELPEVEIFHENSEIHKELDGRVSESSSGKSAHEELGKAQIEIDNLREEKERLQQEVDRLTKALETSQLDTSNFQIFHENREYRVAPDLLAQHSKFFKNMLHFGGKEAQTNRCELDSGMVPNIESILRFMINGGSISVEDITPMVAIGVNSLEMDMMKVEMERNILWHINFENVDERLIVGKILNLDDYSTVVDFFISHLEAILSNPNWSIRLIEYPEIFVDIIERATAKNRSTFF